MLQADTAAWRAAALNSGLVAPARLSYSRVGLLAERQLDLLQGPSRALLSQHTLVQLGACVQSVLMLKSELSPTCCVCAGPDHTGFIHLAAQEALGMTPARGWAAAENCASFGGHGMLSVVDDENPDEPGGILGVLHTCAGCLVSEYIATSLQHAAAWAPDGNHYAAFGEALEDDDGDEEDVRPVLLFNSSGAVSQQHWSAVSAVM